MRFRRRVRYALPVVTALLATSPALAQDIALRLPVACEIGRTCFIQHYVDRDPSPAAQDFQCGVLTYDGHDGTDIRLPDMAAQRAGVLVLAAAGGTVLRARDGAADRSVAESGRQRVENRECGNGVVVDHGGGWETQYCHMARGSVRVRPGDTVGAGAALGRIGLSGLTEFPHLHFTVRKDGKTVDPFARGGDPKSCGGGATLWAESERAALAYRAGTVLNRGFATGPVAMQAVEAGDLGRDRPGTRSAALVAFVRAIGLRRGDIQSLTLTAPGGEELAANGAPPLDSDKAQYLLFAGVRTPPAGFAPGVYRAAYRVLREGRPVIDERFEIDLQP